MKKRKTAIVLGATGLTGGLLLDQLLKDERYEKVKVFTRRSLGFTHLKLVEFKVDLLQLTEQKNNFTGDEVFCCIGSTQKKTPNNDVYEKVDVGIPTEASGLAKENQIKTFIMISALGANLESRFFTIRSKEGQKLIFFTKK